MYSCDEIKNSLRDYMSITEEKAFDEQLIIDILDQGADRNFDKAASAIKGMREKFGTSRRKTPEWLRMLTFRLIYDCMASKENVTVHVEKKQEVLLAEMGFNKKVFDSTSWNMYSPEMKIRQSRFDPPNIPFRYAEVESNPIYVAMLHHLISESRVNTKTFIDVFGKMGYVPAFCAEGYTHKYILTPEKYSILRDDFIKYQKGLKSSKKTNKYLEKYYLTEVEKVLDEEKDKVERGKRIERIISGTAEIAGLSRMIDNDKQDGGRTLDYCMYSATRFASMCLAPSYWINKNVKYSKNNLIKKDYSSRKTAKEFVNLSRADFFKYAKAIGNVEYLGNTLDFVEFLQEQLKELKRTDTDAGDSILKTSTSLLYINAPTLTDYRRVGLTFKEYNNMYMKLIEVLLNYKGDWILTRTRENWKKETTLDNDKWVENNDYSFTKRFRKSDKALYEYRVRVTDRNIRTSVRFVTNIDFDEICTKEFETKYRIELTHGENFEKRKLN